MRPTRQVIPSFPAYPRESPGTIVLDIRLNGGGDNTLIEPLQASFRSIGAFQTKGRFYVIIGRFTQSAAENFR